MIKVSTAINPCCVITLKKEWPLALRKRGMVIFILLHQRGVEE
jgi:hypothetical protein